MSGNVAEAKKRIQECLKTKSTSLSLGLCELTTLDKIPELLELKNLTELNLGGNQLTDISPLQGLKQLKGLNLSHNQLTDISPLQELKQLRVLFLTDNQLTDISQLQEPKQLKELNLSHNQLTDISSLQELKQLTNLDLGYNQLTDINPLQGLKQLTELNLNQNQLTDKSITVLRELKKITSLILSRNQLTDISPLKGLKQLTTLHLYDNQLTNISPLQELKQLTHLNLINSQLTDKSITILKELKQLTILLLSNNQITDINPLESLKQIEVLCLNHNQITSIPKFIFHLPNWKDIVEYILVGNPISNPPVEKIEQGKEAVLEWFKAHKVSFKEIKVLLVGEPEAGKTSLLKVLKEDLFNLEEPQTDGINIVDIDFEKNEPNTFAQQKKLHGVKARFWDFGGQEILNATHKLFFTSRSLYILMFKARGDNDIDKQIKDKVLEIQSGGGNSPILVVVNRIDKHPSFEFINTYDLQKEFPQIKGFIKTSCATGENIDVLKDTLETLIPNAGFLDSEISKEEMDLKNKILELTQSNDFIDERQFNKISKDIGLFTSSARINAIDLLDKLGLALYFSKIKTSSFYILDPNWVTTALYRIITSQKIAKNGGLMLLSDLDYILNEETQKKGEEYKPFKNKEFKYPCKDEQYFLSQILIAYKLAFKINEETFILPNLLKGNPEKSLLESFEQKDTLKLIYDYGKMPANIMSQIIVDLSQNTLSDYWRTGCMIERNNCEALITSYSNRIEIVIKGDDKIERRNLMVYITAIIELINTDLPQLPEKLIPLPNTGSEVKHQELLNRFNTGQKKYIHNEYLDDKKEFDIGLLLDGIPSQTEIEKEIQKMQEKLDDIPSQTEKAMQKMQEKLDGIDSKLDKQRDYLIQINPQNQKIKDEIIASVNSVSEDTQKRVCQDMLQLISNAFELHQADMDNKLTEIYQELQNEEIVSSKLELAIPLLNVLGVTYKKEIDLNRWKDKMYKKYELPLFKLFGYVQ